MLSPSPYSFAVLALLGSLLLTPTLTAPFSPSAPPSLVASPPSSSPNTTTTTTTQTTATTTTTSTLSPCASPLDLTTLLGECGGSFVNLSSIRSSSIPIFSATHGDLSASISFDTAGLPPSHFPSCSFNNPTAVVVVNRTSGACFPLALSSISTWTLTPTLPVQLTLVLQPIQQSAVHVLLSSNLTLAAPDISLPAASPSSASITIALPAPLVVPSPCAFSPCGTGTCATNTSLPSGFACTCHPFSTPPFCAPVLLNITFGVQGDYVTAYIGHEQAFTTATENMLAQAGMHPALVAAVFLRGNEIGVWARMAETDVRQFQNLVTSNVLSVSVPYLPSPLSVDPSSYCEVSSLAPSQCFSPPPSPPPPPTPPPSSSSSIWKRLPWLYVLAGGVGLIIVVVVIALLHRRRKVREQYIRLQQFVVDDDDAASITSWDLKS